MKQLEAQFTLDNNNFTQVKRSAKAAIYKRETLEGQPVSYEVFAIKFKNGSEVYPNQTAFSKWAWCPITLDKATKFFNRIDTGEVVIPDVDPETGEFVKIENDPSLEELLAQDDVVVDVTQDDPTVPNSEPVVEVSMETVLTDSPTVEDVVTPTADGGAIVTVAKVKTVKNKTVVQMVIPTGEFTQAQFAAANGLPARGVVWGKLDALVKEGKLNKSMKQIGKGRPSQIFNAV